jgi:hypothetical protein
LIELVAAAVLAAMMTAALTGILGSAVRESIDLRRADLQRTSPRQLIALIRRDLINARGIRVAADGIQLHGFLDEDPDSGEPTGLPARVIYRRTGAGQMLLTRGTVGPSGMRRKPLWLGVGALTIESLEETTAEDALLVDSAAGGLPPVPGRFLVTLRDDRGQPLWREVIHHHGH